MTIQPSEFAKISVIVWTAAIAVRKARSEHFKSLSLGLGPFFLMWGILLLPVALEPDLSTAVLTLQLDHVGIRAMATDRATLYVEQLTLE